jgi:hypothetical protein
MNPAIDVDLRGYYQGEEIAAYVIGGTGAAAAAGGAYLATRNGDFARGLGWSWIGFGGLEAIAAVFYALQVDGEITHYEGELARDPSAYRTEERSITSPARRSASSTTAPSRSG